MFRALEGRWGSREVEIVGVELVGNEGRGQHVFQSGDSLEIQMQVRANQPVNDLVFGVGIFNAGYRRVEKIARPPACRIERRAGRTAVQMR